MRWKVLILVSAATIYGVTCLAADLNYGPYGRLAGSRQFYSIEAGYWVPHLEFDIAASGGGGGPSCDELSLAGRAGVEAARDRSSRDFEGRIHTDVGLGTCRVVGLVGPYVAFGPAAQSFFGGRGSVILRIRPRIAAELTGELSPHRKPRVAAGVVFSF